MPLVGFPFLLASPHVEVPLPASRGLMAKEKRSAADLDAELAALEAELAALEGKPKKAKPTKPVKTGAPAPAPPPARESAPAEPAPQAPAEKKSRFGLPKFGKKKDTNAQPVSETIETASPPPAPEVAPVPAASSPLPAADPPQSAARSPPPASYDASVWHQDGDAWVRIVPETRIPVVRRVLDENGNVVREEPADLRQVEGVSSVKAERGLGRLLRRK